MKNILIMGGAGKIGFNLVNKLVDSEYNVTVLDLESQKSKRKFKKYQKSIKVVYGDIEDATIVKNLIKKNDVVIDYAGIMPPLANLNENISNSTNYVGLKNIVDAIGSVNPTCQLIYMSFISVYGESKDRVKRLSSEDELNPSDIYSTSIVKSEKYIQDHIKNFTIIRMPIVLTDKNYYISHMELGKNMDFIVPGDLNRVVIDIIGLKNVNGKIYNISGFKANSYVLVKMMYDATGKLGLFGRSLYYGEYEDDDEINKLVNVKYKSANRYFKDLKLHTNFIVRALRKFINLPKYLIIKRKSK